MLTSIAILFLVGLFFFFPQTVSAHAFGQMYTLPVPFWLYMYGGAAALVVSFVIIGYFFNKTSADTTYSTKKLPSFLFFLTHANTIRLLQILSVCFFLFIILTGLIGEDISTSNINMSLFWIIFALGFTYFVAIFGDIWEVVNPWKVVANTLERFLGSLDTGIFDYPQYLGYYPAFFLYYLFIWTELFGKTTPLSLSLILILYSTINAVGITMWGKSNWFFYGEFFSVFYRLLGKMAITASKKNTLVIRPPFVGLLSEKADHFSLVLFIIFMLASTAFDGFHTVTSWVLFVSNLSMLFGPASYELYQSIGLFLSPFAFLLLYLAFIYVTKRITNTASSTKNLCLTFAYSLIPIAFVYNVAHYYTLLLTEGQNFIRLISDPMGFGWNIFGTAHNFDLFIPPANFIWHSQVAVILFGHIVGVYIAHLIALRTFPNHKKALISQIPMLFLMVCFTMAGLWILSQPITGN